MMTLIESIVIREDVVDNLQKYKNLNKGVRLVYPRTPLFFIIMTFI